MSIDDGRRAERHDPGDEVGAADGERAGEHAAAALADDRHAAAPVRLGERLEALLEPRHASSEQPTLARIPARRVQ